MIAKFRTGVRHRNFYIAVGVGVAAAILTLLFAPDLFPAVAASLFSLSYLILTAIDMPRLNPDFLRQHAGDEDAPPWIVFLVTIALLIYVTTALFMVVNQPTPDILRLGLGTLSVVLSWLMLQVMWGMHYAWEYYEAPGDAAADEKQRGGLSFPGDEEPDGMDFVYFSMVIAMTDQTSDTDVTSGAMRRIVTGHSLFSYLFNTVIVAAAINIVLSLGQ